MGRRGHAITDERWFCPFGFLVVKAMASMATIKQGPNFSGPAYGRTRPLLALLGKLASVYMAGRKPLYHPPVLEAYFIMIKFTSAGCGCKSFSSIGYPIG